MNKYFLVFVIFFALSACGGGGGGGSSASSATNWTSTKCTGSYTNSDGVIVPCAYQTFNTTQNGTTGNYNPDDYEQEDFGGWSGTFNAETETSQSTYRNESYECETRTSTYNSETYSYDVSFSYSTNTDVGEVSTYQNSSYSYPSWSWRGDCGYRNPDVTTYTETSSSFSGSSNNDIPMHHLTDTGATTAWAAGWTGQGTNINIIDDASWNAIDVDMDHYYFDKTVTFGNGTTTNQYTGTYRLTYSDNVSVSHGWIVKNIAGGDKRTDTSYVKDTDFHSAVTQSCIRNKVVTVHHPVIKDEDSSVNERSSSSRTYSVVNDSTAYTSSSDQTKYCNFSNWSTPTWSVTPLILSPGVAKDATMTTSNVDLSPYQNPSTTWAYIKGFMENSTSFDAVNLSLGLSINSNTYDWAYLKDNSEIFSFAGNPSGVYVIAAGNSSAPCTSSNFANCNLLAGIMTLNSSLQTNTIVAGATDTVSGVKTIATYSNQAGVMKDRYLMANGDSGWDEENSSNTGDDVEGTSFAAPRIAGAAAIVKSKFPNLTGANVADILLLTADKDINDDGTDDFSSVSSVYGRGELDLSSALSPVGNLTP